MPVRMQKRRHDSIEISNLKSQISLPMLIAQVHRILVMDDKQLLLGIILSFDFVKMAAES